MAVGVPGCLARRDTASPYSGRKLFLGLRLGLGGTGAHGFYDAFQVVGGGELDDYFAFVPAHFYFDAGFEEVGEAVGQAAEAGGDGLPARGTWSLGRSLLTTEGNDLLDATDRQALGHDPGG